MKKLLIIYDVSYPHLEGGGQKRLYELGKRFAQHNFIVDWICFKTWEDPENTKVDGIKYIGLDGFNGLYSRNGSRRLLEPFEFSLKLLPKIKTFKSYDYILVAQWPIIHLIIFFFLSFSRKFNEKVFIDWWEYWGDAWYDYIGRIGFIPKLIESFIIKALARKFNFISISEIGLTGLQKITKFKNIKLIHNGINLEDFDIKQDSKKYDFIYFGRLKNHKNVSMLINSLRSMNTDTKKYSLAIIGDGPEKILLEKLTQDLNLEDSITFFGEISDFKQIIKLMKQSKIFVNPSLKEGGGSITLFEAYAASLPVIIVNSKDGIDPKLVLKNNCGLVSENASIESLSSTMLRLINNNNLLEQMSINARKEANQYSWNSIYLQYLNFFENEN